MIASTTQRVPEHTAAHVNERIWHETERNIAYYSQQSPEVIDRRLEELDQEWDIERTLEANAAGVTLAGFLLGTLVSRKWYILPGIVGAFLLQHAVQGWCPPVPLLRRLGFRTEHEIERERHALLGARESHAAIHISGPNDIGADRGFRG
jgi:hypothetical protein